MSLICVYLLVKTFVFKNEHFQLVFKLKTTPLKIQARTAKILKMRLGYCSSCRLFYVICGARIWRKVLYSLYKMSPGSLRARTVGGSQTRWEVQSTRSRICQMWIFLYSLYIYTISSWSVGIPWDSSAANTGKKYPVDTWNRTGNQ
jgi:hypothetical protein